ncbi:hypothetical protein OS122_02735 [Mycolicibacterium mucogenicum]|uniref:hypothetical protein n=1 Tax=Mycolicibacterium mucogenicum TaxID=56689 RepID=UPI00226AFAFE|nr:hypothetical protein [Mycolicibacterium mucogenicum]MCX8559815.1 hypothetical protein [Mycolicibacterium mucogenicum]
MIRKTLLFLGLVICWMIPMVAFLALPVRADTPFVMCPSGRAGVATAVTSCAFAENVRRGYYRQGSGEVIAYSPVTDAVYDMWCQPGYRAVFNNGVVVTSALCVGGSNAAVVVW